MIRKLQWGKVQKNLLLLRNGEFLLLSIVYLIISQIITPSILCPLQQMLFKSHLDFKQWRRAFPKQLLKKKKEKYETRRRH